MTVNQRAYGHHTLCAKWLQECRPKDGLPFLAAEIGVASGANAMRMLQSCPDLRLLMVDPWYGDDEYRRTLPMRGPWAETLKTVDGLNKEEQEWYEAAVRDTEFASNRRVIMRMSSIEATKLISDFVLSFCFIDGDHRYAEVQADMTAWYSKVRSGGIFAGHDYGTRCHIEVGQAVNDWSKKTGRPFQTTGRCWWMRKE